MSEIKYRLAVDPSQLTVQLSGVERQFSAMASNSSRDLAILAAAGGRVGDALVLNSERAARSVERMTGAMARVGHYTAAIGASMPLSQLARGVAGMADEMASMEGRLKLATHSTREYAQAQADVAAIADRQKAGLSAIGDLYAKTASVADDLGASQADVAKVTEAVAASLRLNGTGAQASAGALQQLGQALGGTNVQAEEFNSILDGARPLLAAAAKHIDGTGGSLSKLKELVSDGKVSSKDFFQAILLASDELTNSAAKLPLTIGQATTQMRNDALKLVGDFDKVTGSSQGLAGAIQGIGAHLDLVAIAGIGLAGVIGGRLLDAMRGTINARIVGNAYAVQELRTKALLTEASVAEAAAQVGAARAMNLGVGSAAALAAAETRLAQAQAVRAASQSALTAATSAGSAAAGLAGGAVAMLGGPLGITLGLLSAGAAAWALWKAKATDASAAAAEAAVDSGAAMVAQLEREIALIERRLDLSGRGIPRSRQGSDAQMAELQNYSDKIAKINSDMAEMKQRGASTVFKQQELDAQIAGYVKLVDTMELHAKRTEQAAAREEGDKRIKWLVQLGDKTVQLQQELKKAKADFGGLIPPDIEAAIRKKFADPVKGVAVDLVKAGVKLQADLTAQGGGLAADFAEKWDSLSAAYKANGWGVDKLTQAQALLLAQQPLMKEAADKQAQATKAAADALEQQYASSIKAAQQSANQAEERVTALQLESAGMDLAKAANIALAEAVERLQVARLQEAQAEALSYGDEERAAAIGREIVAREKLGKLMAGKDLRDKAKEAGESLKTYLSKDIGANLAAGFDKASQSLGAFVGGVRDLVTVQEGQAQAMRDNLKANGGDLAKFAKAQEQITAKGAMQQINAYGNIAGAAKGFFKEGSKGYSALQKAEQVFRAFELAMSAKAIAQRLMEIGTVTTAKVAGDTLSAQSGTAAAATESAASLMKGQAAAVAGVANQAGGDPYTAFPRIAAMVAIMAGLGFMVSGGGGSASAVDPGNTGTGTVLGDKSAQSASLTKAMEHLAKNSDVSLRYSQGMLSALNTIAGGISGLSGLIVRDDSLTTGANFGIKEGTTLPGYIKSPLAAGVFGGLGGAALSLASRIPGLNKVVGALFGSKTSINGTGLFMGDQTMGSIMAGGPQLQTYADVQRKKKAFGFTYSNKSSTQFQDADATLQRQFGLMFEQFAKGVELAAGPLDRSLEEVRARLSTFVVSIGKINLQGLTGEQIQERLTAVFGAAADSIAGAALPGLNDFQKVGEGYFETVVRVASGVESAKGALERLGVQALAYTDIAAKQGDVDTELIRGSLLAWEQARFGLTSGVGEIVKNFNGSAADLEEVWRGMSHMRDGLRAIGADVSALSADMVRGAGGFDALGEGLEAYFESFMSEGERTAELSRRMAEKFAAAGQAMPKDVDGFKSLVKGIDTTTAAGQALFGKIIALSGGFAELDAAMQASTQQRTEMEGQLLQLQGNTAALRARELAGLDAGLRPLQERIWALQDEQAAAQVATQLASQRQGLESQLLQLQGNTLALRGLELAKLDASLRPLQERIWALQDEQAAAQAAAQLANQRQGLESQLLQLQGNTLALRGLELAKLDASLRPLQERIWALQDEQAAAQAAAQLASQRQGLESQLLQLQGNTLALRGLELAKMDASLRPLQERIWALQDEQAAAQAAVSVANEREGLQQRLLQLEGKTSELRALELAKLDPSNRALQVRLWQIEDERAAAQLATQASQEAAQAGERLRDAWKGVTDGIVEEVKRIKGLLNGADAAEGIASLQAQFVITTAAARANDQEAAKRLPQLSNALIAAATDSATSAEDLRRIQGGTLASLEETLRLLAQRNGVSIPKFESGGNHAGGIRLVGEVGPELELTGPSRILNARQTAQVLGGGDGSGNEGLMRELQALRTEVSELRREQGAQQLAIAGYTQRTAKVLEKVSREGDALTTRATN